ncbi:MAG: squalene synthase HpnC [Rhodoferax sp.]
MHCPTPANPLPLTHYENFPVASWLCPPRLRPAIAAIYWFARTADDVADEGNAPAQQRLDDLAAYRADLDAVADAREPSPRWREVFGPLRAALQDFKLPVPLLADLLSAFEQDAAKSRDRAGYADRDELLDYCRRSANPVGRLLLHLYDVHDAQALARSDCICTALQLINFWQDLGLDIVRGRFYLPRQDCEAHGVTQEDLLALRQTPDTTKLIASHVDLARATMLKGSALVHQVPGRAGWELRLVVQGGLRILDKIGAIGFATLNARPKLTVWDAPVMLWRSLWM